MKRRKFLGLLGCAAAVSLATGAQNVGIRHIGVLVLGNPDPEPMLKELREALRKLDHVEGRDVQFHVRSAGAKASALADAAADLVRLKVDIIVAWQTPAATAAKQATSDIPIVMTAGNPVETGLVASLSRPGGNVTGLDVFGTQLGSKCVELIQDTLPSARRVAMLANAADPFTKSFMAEIEKAASSIGIATDSFMYRPADEFDSAFAEMHRSGVDAVIIQPTLIGPPAIELALKYRLPSFSIVRGFPAAGGLMSFSAHFEQLIQDLAGYVDRILKGNKPADLPVMQPTRFELVINLRTAGAIGLGIPAMLLSRADEVIE